jgi:hypothetical protein
LKFVTKNPNFEHQLIYEYLKNRWFACKSGSNTNYNHHIWYRSFIDSWTLGKCRLQRGPPYSPVDIFLWRVECWWSRHSVSYTCSEPTS